MTTEEKINDGFQGGFSDTAEPHWQPFAWPD